METRRKAMLLRNLMGLVPWIIILFAIGSVLSLLALIILLIVQMH
ncbi:MAG TPA: hypothetical protein VFN57_14745 [Thermomicrobiaceae bacterium]|nr:hypothetical protein [Thermomicrobiaceae bacterium]